VGDNELSSRLRTLAGSVRARTAAGAVLVVGTALLVASIVLVTVMHRAMERNVTDAARLRARDIVASLENGRSPASVISEDDDVLVQVVDSGTVVASSAPLEGDPPLARLGAGESRVVDDPPVGDDDPFAVVALQASAPDGPVLVLVGRNLDLVRETVATVSRVLLVVVPLLLVVAGLTSWAVAGRSLAPVESMRREVTHISDTELHRRVPRPAGDDEIARLADTMNDMLARLDAARERQQRLVSDASHELRNPIAAIRHHAEVALAHPNTTTSRDLAGDVHDEALRLQRLAEDLLLLARADEHTLELDRQPVDVDDLVLDEARRLKQATDLRIDTSGVGAARTRGDVAGLRRVVQNLTDNAARHASSTIRLTLGESDGHVVLAVEDDGNGVPEVARDAVFERFTRLDDARDRGHGGAGLGLAIVAEIVGAHGGRTSLDDAPLGGARFVVALPLVTI
jgi:signal transduction histidine kinase